MGSIGRYVIKQSKLKENWTRYISIFRLNRTTGIFFICIALILNNHEGLYEIKKKKKTLFL